MEKNITQCPICEKENKKSKFYISQYGTSTSMGFETPYYDEEGKYHCHNPNIFGCEWWCSNGHKGTISYGNKCPNCNFGQETKINIENETHNPKIEPNWTNYFKSKICKIIQL